MFLADPQFVRSEMSCPLLKNNRGYLEQNLEECWEQTRCWKKLILLSDPSESASTSSDIGVDFASVRKRAGIAAKSSDGGGTDQLTESIESSLSISTAAEEKSSDEEWSDGFKLRVQTKPERILLRDAERTFLCQKQRQILISMCTGLRNLYADYQQTVSYVSGILLLFFNQKEVFEMMTILGQSPKYSLRGYWRHEALDQAIDAHVLYLLLQTRQPRLHSHLLRECHILPETFLQKYFGCLGVQILPMRTLIQLWTAFFESGSRYLFCFVLTLLIQIGDRLMQTRSPNELYEILGLDRRSRYYVSDSRWQRCVKECPLPAAQQGTAEERARHQWCDERCYQQFFDEVMQSSQRNWEKDEFGLQSEDIFQLRIQAYHNTTLGNSMVGAAMANNFDSMCVERCDGDGNADSTDDENEDCELCEDGFADLFCSECEIYVCERCHNEEAGEHLKTHKVDWIQSDVD